MNKPMTNSKAAAILRTPMQHPTLMEAAIKHAVRVLEGLPDERPMTRDEFTAWLNESYASPLYVEFRSGAIQYVGNTIDKKKGHGIFDFLLPENTCGTSWRCWKFRPSDELREAFAWED